MKPTPPGWPQISSSLYYQDAAVAIDWLCRAFGFEVRIKVEGEGGRIEHSELTFGQGLIMVAGADKSDRMPYIRCPNDIGRGNTQNLFVYVDDIAAHRERAQKAGALDVSELTTSDYGEEHWADRGYHCRDIGGHTWWFAERLRTAPSKA